MIVPITCPTCGKTFKGERLNSRHISVCDPTKKKPVPPCLCGHESTSLTQMKRHRRDCETWKARDKDALSKSRRKATNLERYGVEDASQLPETQARRAATNIERYGAENVFSKESEIFDKVIASQEGNRPVLKGQDNPFAWPEVQEKLRLTMLEKYGAENPQQVPEIREATLATNFERYGVEEVLSSPEIREKIRETCEEKYGGPAPSCDPEVLQKQVKTNLERYGVPWTAMNPEIRQKQLETMEANWGSHFLASEKGKAKVRQAMVDKYGVWHPALMDGFWERNVKTFQDRYGVDHPLQLKKFRDKQRNTNTEKYGNPFPGLSPDGPNLLETRVAKKVPQMMFMGDGSFWRWLPKIGHYKNPDFIVPGPDPKKPKKGVTKVVEVFGDFWHSRIFTGKAPFEHEQELIEAFLDIGITCLVIWESEFKADPSGVGQRTRDFVQG